MYLNIKNRDSNINICLIPLLLSWLTVELAFQVGNLKYGENVTYTVSKGILYKDATLSQIWFIFFWISPKWLTVTTFAKQKDADHSKANVTIWQIALHREAFKRKMKSVGQIQIFLKVWKKGFFWRFWPVFDPFWPQSSKKFSTLYEEGLDFF